MDEAESEGQQAQEQEAQFGWIMTDDKEITIDSSELEHKLKMDKVLCEIREMIENSKKQKATKDYSNFNTYDKIYGFLEQQHCKRIQEICLTCAPKYIIKTKPKGENHG